jgi:hypothetical protein
MALVVASTAVRAEPRESFWTGRTQQVRVRGVYLGVSCEYLGDGARFWRTFLRRFDCPIFQPTPEERPRLTAQATPHR